MQSFPETKDYANRKLAGHYSLQKPQEIVALLEDTLIKAENPDAIYADLNTSDGLNQQEINPMLTASIINTEQVSISQAEFNKILINYQTSYYLLNIFVYIFSFGNYKHESQTIKALRTLSKNDSITKEMVLKALSIPNGDSQQTRRIKFWNIEDHNFNSNSGTDQVLSELKTKFQ